MGARLWTGALHPMPGGIQLPADKSAAAQPIRPGPVSERLLLPLLLPNGTRLEPRVEPGRHVLKGELIAAADEPLATPQHAPTSGRISAPLDHPLPHPSGLSGACLALEPDGEDCWGARLPALTDWLEQPVAALLQRIHEAGIAGLGGAGFPTAVKAAVQGAGETEMLLLNGAECEPCICADDGLMQARAADIVTGAQILARLTAARYCLVAIEADKPAALAAMTAAAEAWQGNGQGVPIEVVAVPAIYPIGGERQLIHALTGLEVPSSGLPSDLGIICQNVGTAAAVQRAVEAGEPLTRRITTVTGSAVLEPTNLDVLLGTPFADLLQACGLVPERMARLIMGGPMMGFAVADPRVPVIKTSNCILAAGADQLQDNAPEQPCIRCGDCADVCPVQLLPQQLYWHARAGDLDAAQQYDLTDCIECGACAWACPSHIPLVQYYRAAKGELAAQAVEQERAEQARRRFEQRQARLAAEAEAREAERRARMKAPGRKQAASSAVAAALARKRKARGSDESDA